MPKSQFAYTPYTLATHIIFSSVLTLHIFTSVLTLHIFSSVLTLTFFRESSHSHFSSVLTLTFFQVSSHSHSSSVLTLTFFKVSSHSSYQPRNVPQNALENDPMTHLYTCGKWPQLLDFITCCS
jgi:hypothetical protein